MNVPRGLYQYAERTGMDADWKDVMAIIRAGYDLKTDPKPLSVPAAVLLADPATEVDAMGREERRGKKAGILLQG